MDALVYPEDMADTRDTTRAARPARPRYAIVPCTLAHLRELARTMRAEDRAELEAAGLVPRHVLYRLWRASAPCRAAVIDGKVAVAWGDAGGVLSDTGEMWLFTTPQAGLLPIAFFREARRDIAARLRGRRILRAHVIDGYERALRLYRLLGFAIGEPTPIGPHQQLFREIRLERA